MAAANTRARLCMRSLLGIGAIPGVRPSKGERTPGRRATRAVIVSLALLFAGEAGGDSVGVAAGTSRRHNAMSSGDRDLWTFDRLDRIGGHPTTVLGDPRVVDTLVGKAIEFDGVDDAIFVDVHPLAGAETFTWEAIFRPDGGRAEQRWFHLQEAGTDNRMLFEIRVVANRWYFDSYVHSRDAEKALIN